jgi:type II secretory ATPase GspE/PulE/Tfp pilus assembly ATPase PilB-like protein
MALRQAILARSDTTTLETVTCRSRGPTLREAAARAVAEGHTSAQEIERVLGPA